MTGQPGDIGLVTIKGDVGTLIRIGQWLNGDGFSNYEHAFVLVDDNMIVEGEPGGARHVPLHYENVLWLHCPDQYRRGVVEAAMRHIGRLYSCLDYFALAALRLHIPSEELREYVRSTEHEICSQLADAAAGEGGWHIFNDGRLPQDVTPGDLWQVSLSMVPSR